MTDDSESDEKGLPRRHELIGGGGGGGPHWTRTPGKPVEKDGRLTREVVEASPGGSRRVTVEHDATPAGEEDPDEKKRRVARNKQASKRARTRLDIEVRCDHGGHRGGGPHWTRTPGKPVEKDGRLTREVVEASPGGSRRVTVEHDATPAGEEDPDEKKRRVARNKQASKRARTRLDIEVRCDHGGHRARHHRHASTPPRKHATTPQRVLH